MDASNALMLLVECNEAAKTMEGQAYEVRLHALDALVRSAKDRSLTLAGFREVSSQMRGWGDDLFELVTRLRKQCADTVAVECVRQTLQRRRALAAAAACQEAGARMASRVDRAEEARRTKLGTLSATLEDLRLLGLMAAALSRTAMIEATSAQGEDRTVLMLAAQEFGQQATGVLERGRGLERSVKEAA